jgi:hypothetical protein
MNIKRFINKNKFVVFIVLAAVILFIAYKKTNEGFQQNPPSLPYIPVEPDCNFNYCTGDYELVISNSGVRQCLKKCNVISSGAIVADSDKLICKKMNGPKVSTFSRDFGKYKKLLNAHKNNTEECKCPTKYTYNVKEKACLFKPKGTDKICPISGRSGNKQLRPVVVNGVCNTEFSVEV